MLMERMLEAAITEEGCLPMSARKSDVGRYDPWDGERFLNLFADVSFSAKSHSPLLLVGDLYHENMELFDKLAARNMTASSYQNHNASTAAWAVSRVLTDQGRTIAGFYGVSPEVDSALAFYDDYMTMTLFHVAAFGRLGVTADEIDRGVRACRMSAVPVNGVTSRMSETTRFDHVCQVLGVPARNKAWSYSIQELSDAVAAGLSTDDLWHLGKVSNDMERTEFQNTIRLMMDGVPREYLAAAHAD